jgi:D-serine deaminase-like pyridoxal phosphate-dependent protein
MSSGMGMAVVELDTPSLLVDLDRLESNIAHWAGVAQTSGVRLRPHFKTHKCIEIARMQQAAGAAGFTVAKVGEAEVMVGAGFTDIFVAYEVVGPSKLQRLITLARTARIRVAVDSIAVATALSEAAVSGGITLDVLIEVETGLGRCGVLPGQPLLDLAKQVEALPGLRVVGIFTYRGYRPNPEEAGLEEGTTMAREADYLRRAGIRVDEVSAGSTPTGRSVATVPGVTEIRPGTYVFYDATQVVWGIATLEQCALTALARVISRPARDVAILDAGSKVLTTEFLCLDDKRKSYGIVRGLPKSYIDRLWEEHSRVRLSEEGYNLKVGDLVEIIPAHACPTVNLATDLVCVRGGYVVDKWEIAARGRVQ